MGLVPVAITITVTVTVTVMKIFVLICKYLLYPYTMREREPA